MELLTGIRYLPCGHGEWFDGHCAVLGCPAYINLCDLHCRDDEQAACSLGAAS